MDSCWNRMVDSLASPVMLAIRLPFQSPVPVPLPDGAKCPLSQGALSTILASNRWDFNLQRRTEWLRKLSGNVAADLVATGMNTWVLDSWLYFVFLLVTAWLAAVPASLALFITCASAYVSDTVTSQANGLPLDQGRMVVPSGRFPSCRITPTGSLTAGICARFMDRQRMSLRWLWRCCLGALLLQAKPCRPRASTALPHTHVWGSHALHPSLCATAIHNFFFGQP